MKRETTNSANNTNEAGDVATRSGARIALLAVMALGSMLAAWPVVGQMPSDNPTVTPRKGPSRIQDGVLDAEAGMSAQSRRENPTSDADFKLPRTVTFTNGVMRIERNFVPPSGWAFRRLDSSGSAAGLADPRAGSPEWRYWTAKPNYVDIWADLENTLSLTASAVNAGANPDSASEIVVRGEILPPQTAAQFPLRCEGNLRPPPGGGGSGGTSTFYWASHVIGGIDLHIDSDNNGDMAQNWAPDRSAEERAMKNVADKPGRLVMVNNGDSNVNGVPDYVEPTQTTRFVVMELDIGKIASTIDLGACRLEFRYNDSDPSTNAYSRTTHPIAGKTVTNAVPASVTVPGTVRLWRKDGPDERTRTGIEEEGDYIPAGTEFPPSKLTWNNNIARIYVEGISSGTGTIEAVLKPAGWPAGSTVGDSVKVTVVDIGLRPDRNRDRVIDADDRIAALRWPIYRFWKNNDQDEVGTAIMPAGDYLLSDEDGNAQKNGIVDGIRDLIDIFPVQVDIGQALEALTAQGLETTVRLKHEDDALSVVFGPEINPSDLGAYLTDPESAVLYQINPTELVLASGKTIPAPLLSAARNGSAVALFEGRADTQKPLVLEIRAGTNPNGAVIVRTELPLRISSTMQMMRWRKINWAGFSNDGVNLSDVPGQSENEPPNWPDSEANGKLVVFVHGFNEDNSSAAGHASTIFKRLYWSGSCAGFAAVRWPGNLLLGGGSGTRLTVLHFQLDMKSALVNAQHLKGILEGFRGNGWNRIHLIAHSLGAMICSEALRLAPANTVDTFTMLNAALAVEAFVAQPAAIDDKMVHYEWRDYADRAYMSEWWRLFDASDARHSLTWRGRYSTVLDMATVFNAYSPSEDVLALRDEVPDWALWAGGNIANTFWGEDVGSGSWQAQETWKGRNVRVPYYLRMKFHLDLLIKPSRLISTFDYGGWSYSEARELSIHSLLYERREADELLAQGFEVGQHRPPTRPIAYEELLEYLKEYLSSVEPEKLRTDPLFVRQGYLSPSGIMALYGGTTPEAKQAAATFIEANTPELLARMIPAITGPAGSRPVPGLIQQQNINYEDHQSTPWPRPKAPGKDSPPWWHRDHRYLAYVYVWKLYDKLADDVCNVRWRLNDE